MRRIIDLALAVPLCIALGPLLAAIAVAVRVDSPGPALFRQRRYGRGMKPFTIFKFRSLRHNVPDPTAHYEMVSEDSRITRVGAFLRRTSLDELPQLFNVVAGSMSLVGPRPLVEWESHAALPGHAERFLVKPGITGLSQVTVRNSVDFHARLDHDVIYVRRQTMLLDLWILLKTPAYVFRKDAIYPES